MPPTAAADQPIARAIATPSHPTLGVAQATRRARARARGSAWPSCKPRSAASGRLARQTRAHTCTGARSRPSVAPSRRPQFRRALALEGPPGSPWRRPTSRCEPSCFAGTGPARPPSHEAATSRRRQGSLQPWRSAPWGSGQRGAPPRQPPRARALEAATIPAACFSWPPATPAAGGASWSGDFRGRLRRLALPWPCWTCRRPSPRSSAGCSRPVCRRAVPSRAWPFLWRWDSPPTPPSVLFHPPPHQANPPAGSQRRCRSREWTQRRAATTI
mmetsp:Transcript_5666/g.24016  ORF Transcript_5666/g.24016 Transcript_5666/m.24016 type:complete len:273 (-) Transcript_5666:1107-1925(-)